MTALDEHTLRVITSVVDGVDHVAQQMEHKWGVGRLRLLVSADLRARFDAQRERFNRAVFGNDAEATAKHGQAMSTAWQKLDEAATAAGAKPLDPEVWETATDDGEVIAIARTNAEAATIFRQNRAMRVFTLAEIGRVIGHFPELLMRAKEVFPGATVEAVHQRATFDVEHGDELPI